jgi:predicted DNA-binding protein YlxM (UPF0122 family)
MKTVAQIAREIGVSKQAVHSKIKNEPLKSKLQGLTETVDNALHINVDGEMLIKSAFKDKLSTSAIDELTTKIDETSTELIRVLKEQIAELSAQNADLRRRLDEERKHSREQSGKILQLAEQGQKLAENAQTLQAENVRPQFTEGAEMRKSGFFSRFKKNK